jgi:hypothetical protein
MKLTIHLHLQVSAKTKNVWSPTLYTFMKHALLKHRSNSTLYCKECLYVNTEDTI